MQDWLEHRVFLYIHTQRETKHPASCSWGIMEVVVKRKKSISYSISKPRIIEPERDQTKDLPIKKKNKKEMLPFSLPILCSRAAEQICELGGSLSQVSCPFCFTTLSLPQEAF